MTEQTISPASNAKRRRNGLVIVGLMVLLAALIWGTWHWLHGRYLESTDNAYVAGNVIQITSQIAGTVTDIGVEETDYAQSGQWLIKLDPTDAKVALEQAQAQLAQTVRETRALYANVGALQAQLSARQADAVRAQTDLSKLEEDVRRRTPLLSSGAVGKEEYEHAQQLVNTARQSWLAAQAAVQVAKEQLLASQSQTDGVAVANHPSVERAAARLREAYLALQRCQLVAPINGHIAKRSVQLGQRIQAGAPLMTLVALDQVWVDANFKESQLQNLRIGQKAELTADLYGEKVTYHGQLVGLGAGTGAAFALLPAQNATGNWIKVVQRVPVRIGLDAKELVNHPLRIGLSMEVNVDTHEQTGKILSDASREARSSSTSVYQLQEQSAQQLVSKIIAANLGHAGKSVKPNGVHPTAP
jgi:membrane fusion protein (multidrug efflux system)